MTANGFRRLLIRTGKSLPFVACAFLLEHYFECMLAVLRNDYVMYDGSVILNTPLSFFIGSYIEYNIQMLVVLAIISFAIETCIYNKLACMYLGVNLIEKSFFSSIELCMAYIFSIAFINMLASGFFTYKGIVMLTKTERLWT